MKNKQKETNPFVQIPKTTTPVYEFNKQTRTLEFVEFRDDVKYIEENKNLTFKEMLEKYGTNFITNKNDGINLDQTLIYNDINTMWNAGQQYQRQKQEITNKQQLEAQQQAEQIKNIEVVENGKQE